MVETATCVFCGRCPTTEEHVWPDWVSEMLIPKGLGPVELEMTSADAVVDTWMAPNIEVVAKVVCADCNSEWMSRLETRAKRLIVPMLRGEQVALNKQDQDTLSIWAIKTMMMFQWAHPIMLGIPAEHFDELYRDRSRVPGANTMVWISRFDPSESAGLYHAVPLRRTRVSDPEGYVSSFTVGQTLFVAYGNSIDDLPTIEDPQPGLIRIHPRNQGATWPPEDGLCFSAEGFRNIVMSFMED